jgi:hypothetical protein
VLLLLLLVLLLLLLEGVSLWAGRTCCDLKGITMTAATACSCQTYTLAVAVMPHHVLTHEIAQTPNEQPKHLHSVDQPLNTSLDLVLLSLCSLCTFKTIHNCNNKSHNATSYDIVCSQLPVSC